MKSYIVLLLTFYSLSSFSQVQKSELKLKGKDLRELVPKGWIILDSAKGDLNKDGRNDLAFVIQHTDPKNIQLNQNGLGRDTIDLNPRIMAIYFADSVSGTFSKNIQCNDFIILCDNPTMDEPFDGIEITPKGILKIKFHFWFSAGSWETSNHTYIFRYQNNEFALIGYESSEIHRGSGEAKDYSLNFSTKKMSISTGTISDDKPTNVQWKTFKLDKLKTLKTLKKPFEWEFEGLYL